MREEGNKKHRATEKLRGALTVFHKAAPQLATRQLLAFLYIASHEGVTIVGLGEAMAQVQPNASRDADALTTHGRGNKKGAGLVERRDVAGDRRLRELYLTPKGRRLLEKLEG